jgi:phosphatase NudJ
MPREPLPTWFIVLVVVRQGDRFLLIQEAKQNQPWYFPAGRVEPGEGFLGAARRETFEEAGIPVMPDGIIRFEHNPLPDGTSRVRLILTAHPTDDTPPKNYADEESLKAAWVTLEEMKRLPLRSLEVLQICLYLAEGGAVYPLDLLTPEGAPYPTPGR